MDATLVGNSLAIALKLPVRKAEFPQASNILKYIQCSFSLLYKGMSGIVAYAPALFFIYP